MDSTSAERPATLLSRLVRRLLIRLYRWKGWTLSEDSVIPKRCVILGAPHTSNWDFVFFLGATSELGVKPAFMGKHTLFKWPMTRFMYDMGGVPVNRTKGGNYVEALIAEFGRRRELALVIAPEGTRSATNGWKSGFYHIALGAGVPIVPAWVNNATMKGGIGPSIMPTGNIKADFARIAAFYRSVLPGHPRNDGIEANLRKEGESDA